MPPDCSRKRWNWISISDFFSSAGHRSCTDQHGEPVLEDVRRIVTTVEVDGLRTSANNRRDLPLDGVRSVHGHRSLLFWRNGYFENGHKAVLTEDENR